MRLHRNDIAFFGLVAVLLAALGSGLLLPRGERFGSSSASQAPASATDRSTDSIIAAENAHPGTSGWEIPTDRKASTEIQAYASATSVLPGQRLTFYVSVQNEGTRYSIEIYRLGWYGGPGGRLKALQENLIGHAQGYYNSINRSLVNCRSCYVDTRTGLVEANWQPSYTFTVPPDWITGVYLAKFIDTNSMQTYVPFDVRGNFHSRYVVVTPDTTYAAYNEWGSYSLYKAPITARADSEGESSVRGEKVSFDRPYATGYGSSQVLVYEANAIHWLEYEGYELSYISNVDLHNDPSQLLHHRAYISLGHDEYWTKEMRDGVEHARDHGVGLAFLGANAAYWQMRFEPDSAGLPNRTVVCYKVQTGNNDLARDPLYGKDNTRVTSQWRDPVLNRPENALIGIMYSSLVSSRFGFPWQVSSLAKSTLLDRTGLEPGQQYGCDIVGYEWDRIFANGATPAGLQVLATSHTVSYTGAPDTSNTTYYIAPSGAMVFATGSIYWTTALDSYRLHQDELCASQSPVIYGIQLLMSHVMDALTFHHPSGKLTPTPTT